MTAAKIIGLKSEKKETTSSFERNIRKGEKLKRHFSLLSLFLPCDFAPIGIFHEPFVPPYNTHEAQSFRRKSRGTGKNCTKNVKRNKLGRNGSTAAAVALITANFYPYWSQSFKDFYCKISNAKKEQRKRVCVFDATKSN